MSSGGVDQLIYYQLVNHYRLDTAGFNADKLYFGIHFAGVDVLSLAIFVRGQPHWLCTQQTLSVAVSTLQHTAKLYTNTIRQL